MHRPQCARLAAVVLIAVAGCREVTVPNYNSPDAGTLTSAPDANTIKLAVVGMIGNLRGRVAVETSHLGVMGKESYILEPSELRFTSQFLGGPIDPREFIATSNDFGWSGAYRNLKQGAIILEAVTKLPDFTDAEKEGIRGFVKTFMAHELFTQIRIRDTAGVVIDISAADAPPAPVASKTDVLTRIATLLDEAKAHLDAGGASFVFSVPSGFSLFNTPATFARFNRGIKARVEVHRGQWTSALAALSQSFIDTTSGSAATLSRGATHNYATGEANNGMLATNIFVHPSIITGAQTRANGQPDLRLTQKTAATTTRVLLGVQGTHRFNIYQTNTTAVPILKNEELILLRAEARYQSGDVEGALKDVNFIRVNSGGLGLLAGFASQSAFIDELLYNRTYSLLFEYGHRWVDARRYGRLAQLPKLNPGVSEKTFPYIMFPQVECEPRDPKPVVGCSAVLGM
jgi:hypothetical protein